MAHKLPKIRIIGGTLKGRALTFQYQEKPAPTKALVRKSLFDRLTATLADQTFLDGFAGSGAIGIEALSRGARKSVFIEQDPLLIKSLHKNLKRLNISHTSQTPTPPSPRAEILKGDFYHQTSQLNQSFDLIFLDPPYEYFKEDSQLMKMLTYLVKEKPLLNPAGSIIIERSKKVSTSSANPSSRPTQSSETFHQFLKTLHLNHIPLRTFGTTILEIYQPHLKG